MVTPPTAEPAAVSDLLTQMSLAMPTDPNLQGQLNSQLGRLISAAREDCENYMRRVVMFQTRCMTFPRFPHSGDCLGAESGHFDRPGHAVKITFPPLFAIVSASYVDLTGATQTLPCDYSNGSDPNLPAYCYQVNKGTEVKPGFILPAWSRMWPPTLRVEAAASITFQCGYNASIAVTTTAANAVIASPFPFLQDHVGLPISIPGAGAAIPGLAGSYAPFVSTILSVDGAGNATLAEAPTTPAVGVTSVLGPPIPEPIRQAILITAQDYYTQGYQQDLSPWVKGRLLPYRL
jgi:hypothetical protein